MKPILQTFRAAKSIQVLWNANYSVLKRFHRVLNDFGLFLFFILAGTYLSLSLNAGGDKRKGGPTAEMLEAASLCGTLQPFLAIYFIIELRRRKEIVIKSPGKVRHDCFLCNKLIERRDPRLWESIIWSYCCLHFDLKRLPFLAKKKPMISPFSKTKIV